MRSRIGRAFACHLVAPALVYSGTFAALTYPWARQFSTHFFTNDADGFQNVWNLWWINKAVTELHASPWHTTYLHHPGGMSLLLDTLNPFNGLLAIPLLRYFSLVQTHNTLVAFAFVMAGLTAFWLSHHLTHCWVGSLAAGYVFTFSEFHFAHAQAHMNLVSLEWLPLFVLTFYVLLTRPGVWIAIAAAMTLFAVVLCDYYYFLYAVMTAAMLVVWRAWTGDDWFFFAKRPWARATIWFVAVCAATTGLLVASVLFEYRHNLYLGGHSPSTYALTLPELFVPGEAWRFSRLTRALWIRHQSVETSAFLGYGTILALIYIWRNRRATVIPDLGIWYLLLLVFVTLAMGPQLQIAGRAVPGAILPYAALARLVPMLKVSGVPLRMIVMVTLVGSVFVAEAFRLVLGRSRPTRMVLALALGTLIVIEHLPAPLPATQVPVPDLVRFLHDQPGDDGVFDTTLEPVSFEPAAYYSLYYQTVHQKPVAYGYTSRDTATSVAHDRELQRLAAVGDFRTLQCRHRFKWLLSERLLPLNALFIAPRWWSETPVYVYALDALCETDRR